MSATATFIREARPADVPALLGLMRELAAFERYLDRFALTEAELLARGFPSRGEPQLHAIVAESAPDRLEGYAAYYLVPFTYDLKPTLVLKELFVGVNGRGHKIGAALFERLKTDARQRGCGIIRWAVLPDNLRAKSFYGRGGGEPDPQWEHWRLVLEASGAS